MTRRAAPVSRPVVCTIAGSDSGGGAGIQADLKTIEACGGFGTSAITSVTAQNTVGVHDSHLLPVADIEAQIEAVVEDLDLAATKTGMLATSDVVDLVCSHAPALPTLVVDPVMVAASGDRLLEPAAEDAYADLVAEAALVTPNADEAEVLTGVAVEDTDAAREAGTVLVEDHGADAALVKGGHVPGDHVVDTLVTADGVTTFRHERVDTDATHGSGCALSAAIATHLAHGDDLATAVGRGVDLLSRAVRYHHAVGDGPGAVHHLVALRSDADRSPTRDAVATIHASLDPDAWARIAAPDGSAVAGATVHAEEPADVAAVAVGHSSTADAGDLAGTCPQFGPGEGATATATAALLAAREVDPSIRFATTVDAAAVGDTEGVCDTAGVGDAAVGDPPSTDGLDPSTVAPAAEDVDDATSVAAVVSAAFASVSGSPATVVPPTAVDGPVVVFGISADALADRLAALAGHSD